MSWTVEKKEYTHWTLAMKCNLCTVCLDCFPFLWHFNNHLKRWRAFRVLLLLLACCRHTPNHSEYSDIDENYIEKKVRANECAWAILWIFTRWHFMHVEVAVRLCLYRWRFSKHSNAHTFLHSKRWMFRFEVQKTFRLIRDRVKELKVDILLACVLRLFTFFTRFDADESASSTKRRKNARWNGGIF